MFAAETIQGRKLYEEIRYVYLLKTNNNFIGTQEQKHF